MLADPQSTIIRKFRLLNEAVPPGDRAYGVPHPVIFFVDTAGIVTRKYAEEHFVNWRTFATILAEGAAATGLPVGESVVEEYITVQPLAVQREVYPGNRFALSLEVRPRAGVHLYAPGAGRGYQALTLRLQEQPYFTTFVPTYPPPDRMWSSPENGQEPIYSSATRVQFEVVLANRQVLQPVYDAGGVLRIEGTLSVQACTESACWPPKDIAVSWSFRLIPPDLERPPVGLQREQLSPKLRAPS